MVSELSIEGLLQWSDAMTALHGDFHDINIINANVNSDGNCHSSLLKVA
ncbi:hypothetical protein [Bradyrhizobium sp. BR 1432]